MNNKQNLTNINWYPGHMAKTKREIVELLPNIDFVFELIDARIPLSSKIKDFDEVIKDKPKILVMTKADLCDIRETKLWVDYYEKKGYIVSLVSLKNNNDFENTLALAEQVARDINKQRESKGMKTKEITALVIGIPNVGKSTFINRLAGKKVANVGNRPGVTTNLAWLNTKYGIKILDTPGILWPKLDNQDVALNLASMSAIKSEIIDVSDVALHILKKLDQFYPQTLETLYNINHEDFADIEDIYIKIGKRIGALVRGGDVDYDRVSNFILNDMKTEKIKNVTFDRR